MAASSKRPSRAGLWLTVLAAPVALGFETVLRALLFPPDFDLIREFLEPLLTPVAWGLAFVAGVAALVGHALQGRVTAARFLKLPEDADEDLRYRTAFGVFLLTASVPQIPTILSTFTYMFGASLVPVLVCIGICSAGVVSQALRVPSEAETKGPA